MEWISCDEKRPQCSSFIIVFGKREYEVDWDNTVDEEPNSAWGGFYSFGNFYCFCARVDGDKMDLMVATHWMPLPEPPGALPKRIVKDDFLESMEFCSGKSSPEFIKKREAQKEECKT